MYCGIVILLADIPPAQNNEAAFTRAVYMYNTHNGALTAIYVISRKCDRELNLMVGDF